MPRTLSSFKKLDLMQRLRVHLPTTPAAAKVAPVRGKRLLQWHLPGAKLDPSALAVFFEIQKMKGESDILKYFTTKMEEMKPEPAARREWYHRAVSVCTKTGQLEAALAICRNMVESGIDPPIQTYMSLFRGVSSRHVEYLRTLHKFLTSGVVEVDDFAFKVVMDSMLAIKDPPQRIARAFKVYSAAVRSKNSGWVPPPSMYSVVIRAYASTGQFPKALYWLDMYRTKTLPRIVAAADNSPESASKLPEGHEHGEGAITMEQKIQMWLGLSGQSTSMMNQNLICWPYTAILAAYAKVPKPPPDGLRWFFEYLSSDNVTPDIELCNELISLFFRWGCKARAHTLFERLMTPPSTPHVPNARTFRLLFRGIAPPVFLSRAAAAAHAQSNINETTPSSSSVITSRPLFQVMIAFTRLRLVRRAAREDRNPISCATFNAALNTFMREKDYAAAWVVLTLFPHYGLLPNRATLRTILINLFARMRFESRLRKGKDDVHWVFSFLGASSRHDAVFNIVAKNNKLLADELFRIGRSAYSELLAAGYKTFLPPRWLNIRNRAQQLEDIKFLVGLLRRALVAELVMRDDDPEMEQIIAQKVKAAYHELIPRGRDRHSRVRVEEPTCIVVEDSDNDNDNTG